MRRQLLILSALAAVLVCTPLKSADAAGFGHGGGHGFGRGCGNGFGIGIGGGYNDICGYAELYRELYNNLPYFVLYPPVYYSYPVPRTYGYSPFAYPPDVMTPDIMGASGPVEIINPHMPSSQQKSAEEKTDRTAAITAQPEPLVITNPFVGPGASVARTQ